jgi:hypothetical protein
VLPSFQTSAAKVLLLPNTIKDFIFFCVTYCPCCRSIRHPRPLDASGKDDLNNASVLIAGPVQFDFISNLIVQHINILYIDFLLHNI